MELNEIQMLEQQIADLTTKLHKLRKTEELTEVKNYTFQTLEGDIKLLDMFGDHDTLLLIHNMGQGCRYCTLWADGLNGFVSHIETAMSLVLVSKDTPELQRRFANSRNWRFRMASHGGGDYISEQTVMPGGNNMPGAVVYKRDGDTIFRQSSCIFGPGDLYCTMWNILGLAGIPGEKWTPQFNYWQRPRKMDDGGQNLPD